MQLSESAKRWILFFATWLLGIIFTVAASLKAIDLESFSQQITRYDLVPSGLSSSLAASVVVLEAIFGLSCIIGFYQRKGLWGMIILLSLFVGATAFRWNLLQGTDCNCFGATLVGGPESVLWRNILLISLIGSLIFMMRKATIRYSCRWLRIAAGVVAVILMMFIAQPFSVKSSLSRDVRTEDHIRVFLSATCKQCQKSAGKVRELIYGSEVPPVRVFIGAEYEQQIKDFLKNEGLDIDYTPLTFSQLAREAEQVPTVQVFHGGKIMKKWAASVPNLGEIRQALLAIPKKDESRRLKLEP